MEESTQRNQYRGARCTNKIRDENAVQEMIPARYLKALMHPLYNDSGNDAASKTTEFETNQHFLDNSNKREMLLGKGNDQ